MTGGSIGHVVAAPYHYVVARTECGIGFDLNHMIASESMLSFAAEACAGSHC